jgi:hypothetical protein
VRIGFAYQVDPRIKPALVDDRIARLTSGIENRQTGPSFKNLANATTGVWQYPALRNASFSVGLEHDLQQVHHVCIVHASCYFRQDVREKRIS